LTVSKCLYKAITTIRATQERIFLLNRVLPLQMVKIPIINHQKKSLKYRMITLAKVGNNQKAELKILK
jgi:hypothetical protein